MNVCQSNALCWAVTSRVGMWCEVYFHHENNHDATMTHTYKDLNCASLLCLCPIMSCSVLGEKQCSVFCFVYRVSFIINK